MLLVRETVNCMHIQQTCLPLIREPDGWAKRKKKLLERIKVYMVTLSYSRTQINLQNHKGAENTNFLVSYQNTVTTYTYI